VQDEEGVWGAAKWIKWSHTAAVKVRIPLFLYLKCMIMLMTGPCVVPVAARAAGVRRRPARREH
jgi:hypothetical protein